MRFLFTGFHSSLAIPNFFKDYPPYFSGYVSIPMQVFNTKARESGIDVFFYFVQKGWSREWLNLLLLEGNHNHEGNNTTTQARNNE